MLTYQEKYNKDNPDFKEDVKTDTQIQTEDVFEGLINVQQSKILIPSSEQYYPTSYLFLGISHLFEGLDHILFI